MRIAAAFAVFLLALGTAFAQRHKAPIVPNTPEGELLSQIGSETDEAKKLALLEQFAEKFPDHGAVAWVYEQLIAAETKAGAFDKAMAFGEKVLAIDPGDARSAHAALKAAEAKRDAEAIVKWSNRTAEIAEKNVASSRPEGMDEDLWAVELDFSKQVILYTEYSLYAAVLQAPDPQKRIMLAEALDKRNPDSQYAPAVAEQWFVALMQAGRGEDAVALANRMIDKGKGSAEMMLAAAGAMIGKKQSARAIELAAKAREASAAAAKPEGVSGADWQARQAQIAGRASWIAGVAHAAENRWAEADKALREALPAVRGDQNMLAEALFYLGVANYRLGEAGETDRIKDALEYSRQCAAIPGRFQGPANTNIKAIRARYRFQ